MAKNGSAAGRPSCAERRGESAADPEAGSSRKSNGAWLTPDPHLNELFFT
jgi:hypothetical protein